MSITRSSPLFSPIVIFIALLNSKYIYSLFLSKQQHGDFLLLLVDLIFIVGFCIFFGFPTRFNSKAIFLLLPSLFSLLLLRTDLLISFPFLSIMCCLIQLVMLLMYISSIQFLPYLRSILLSSLEVSMVFVFLYDALAWFRRGFGLPIMIQVITPLIFVNLLLIYNFSSKASFRQIFFLAVLPIYFVTSLLLSFPSEPYIQEIQIIFFISSILAIIAYWFFSLFRQLAPHKFINPRLLVYIPIILVIAICSFFPLLQMLSILLSPFSATLRFAINDSMLESIDPFTLFAGHGPSASYRLWDVTKYSPLANKIGDFDFEFDEMKPHSGLLTLIFDYGVLSLFTASFLFLSRIKIYIDKLISLRISEQNRIDNKSFSPLDPYLTSSQITPVIKAIFLVACVLCLNTLYIGSIPYPEPFHQFGLFTTSISLLYFLSLLRVHCTKATVI